MRFEIVRDDLDKLLARQLAVLRRRHRLTPIHMTLEQSAHATPRAVQQHSLISLADLEDVTNFFGRQPVDVAQSDYLPLPGGQAVNRLGDERECLAPEQAFFGRTAPRRQRRVPVERPFRMIAVKESIG